MIQGYAVYVRPTSSHVFCQYVFDNVALSHAFYAEVQKLGMDAHFGFWLLDV